MVDNYTIDDIQSLDFREGVRTRIAMYLGTDDDEGCYQAFKEIINNSTDEAIAGYGDRIEINVDSSKNLIKVRDYGRGVPFGTRDTGENVLISIYTKSHTGGKFTDSVYKNVSGLNGIGGSCVCLSSSFFRVKSFRDGTMAQADFTRGINTYYNESSTKEKNGTEITFSPDKEVFKNMTKNYDYDSICQSIKDISYLYNGITFAVCDDVKGQTKEFCAKDGIKDFVRDNLRKPYHAEVIYAKASDGTDSVEIAFQWGSKTEESYVFVNGLRCPEGGTPITGSKTAITKTFNSIAKEDFDGGIVRGNLFYVINCSVANPSFANQTKTKINNPNLRTLASNCFSEAIKNFANDYPADFENIAEMLRKVVKAEKAADKARRQILSATAEIEKNQKRKVINSEKLKDAENLGQDSILLIVEGDSAGGAMAQARDYTKFGLLCVRGKLVNCLSNSEDKIYENEEIKLLLSAMNIVPGKYNSKKLRYGRIGICTDSDRLSLSVDAFPFISGVNYLIG